MKWSKFSEQQIAFILRQAEEGTGSRRSSGRCQRWTTCSEKIAADLPPGRHAGPEDFANSIGVFWPIELCGRNGL